MCIKKNTNVCIQRGVEKPSLTFKKTRKMSIRLERTNYYKHVHTERSREAMANLEKNKEAIANLQKKSKKEIERTNYYKRVHTGRSGEAMADLQKTRTKEKYGC